MTEPITMTLVDAADMIEPWIEHAAPFPAAAFRALVDHARRDDTAVEAGTPKGVREALCLAQGALAACSAKGLMNDGQARRANDVLGALVRGVDLHRPLGVGGKHGELHTDTCGCEGHQVTWAITIAPPPPAPPAVGVVIHTPTELSRHSVLGLVVTDRHHNLGGYVPIGDGEGTWAIAGRDGHANAADFYFPVTVRALVVDNS